MVTNFIGALFGGSNDEHFVSVDIGSSSIKLLELDCSGDKPRLINAGMAPSPAASIKNNEVVRPEDVATVIRSIVDANGIEATQVILAVPGPAVFTKKIVVNASSLKDLQANMGFEARNYIPHDINAVKLDYQVLRSVSPTSLEVMLVAVKNEIVDSFTQCIQLAGLEPMIADVDYFAIENMFEVNYPEHSEKTVALVNIGSRYTSVNIMHNSESLFTGDVAVGGRLYTDALCEALQMKPSEAEQAKLGTVPEAVDENEVREILEQTTQHIASELHRQIGFFWNAAATENPIEEIFVCGGGAQSDGLVEALNIKTKIPCEVINVWKGIECPSSFDAEYLNEIAPAMGVSVGIACRRPGDKTHGVEQ